MVKVVSFRPTAQEMDIINRVLKAHGLPTRADAVRFLVREGMRRTSDWTADPLFQFQIDGLVQEGADITSQEIDAALYGGS